MMSNNHEKCAKSKKLDHKKLYLSLEDAGCFLCDI